MRAVELVDAGEVQRAVEPPETFDPLEALRRLPQLRDALQQRADAGVVPALPRRHVAGRVGGRGVHVRRQPGDREGDGVRRQRDDRRALVIGPQRRVAGAGGLRDEPQVIGAELPVPHPRGDGQRGRQVRRHGEPVVQRVRRPGGDLVGIQRGEHVLHVAAGDAFAVAVDDEGVEEVRPRVDPVRGRVDRPAGQQRLAAAGQGEFQPSLVAVGGALGEGVAEGERPHHRFQQHGFARRQRGHGRPQRGGEVAVDLAAGPQAEQVHPHAVLQEPLVQAHGVIVAAQPGEGGVGAGEPVVVDGQRRRVIGLKGRAEVVAGHAGHVTAVAVRLGPRRIVEAGRPAAAHAGQQEPRRSDSARGASGSR